MTTPDTALYQQLPASLCLRNQAPIKARVSLTWTAHMPLVVKLHIGTDQGVEEWIVSRNVFIHAAEAWAKGAWIGGGGAFSICYAADQVMFGLKGMIGNKMVHAVLITRSQDVAEFIAHTQRLLPPSGPEENQAMNDAINTALAGILGGQ